MHNENFVPATYYIYLYCSVYNSQWPKGCLYRILSIYLLNNTTTYGLLSNCRFCFSRLVTQNYFMFSRNGLKLEIQKKCNTIGSRTLCLNVFGKNFKTVLSWRVLQREEKSTGVDIKLLMATYSACRYTILIFFKNPVY